MASSIDYQEIVRDALREVVYRVLAQVADEGLPGSHHFFITFDTSHPGVEMSPDLFDHYPESMTVILQHQFWDLEVDDTSFSVTLSFGGRRESLRVPFDALLSFVDPEAQFGLQFTEQLDLEEETANTPDSEHDVIADDGGPDGTGNVLRFPGSDAESVTDGEE